MGASPVPAQAARVHREAFVMDAHADTLTEMFEQEYDLDAAPEGQHLDFARCGGGNLDAQVFTCFVHPRELPDGAAARVRALLGTMDRQRELFPDRLALCMLPGDLRMARAAGKLGAVLAIEGGHAIEDDLDTLAEFARRGVRTMTLTWNNSNGWADGCGDKGPHGGLTAFGREVVTAMEELGMVVDISHVAPATFDHAAETARGPLLASHSCSRALREHQRNLTDDQLRAIAASGGVACVNFYPPFLIDPALRRGDATLDDLLDHIDRFVSVAGADHVGLGSDFDGIPCGPEGVEDVAALPRVTAGMLARGHDVATTTAVLGGNLLRLFDGPERDGHAPNVPGDSGPGDSDGNTETARPA